MTEEMRPDLQEAKNKAQTLLNTKLTDLLVGSGDGIDLDTAKSLVANVVALREAESRVQDYRRPETAGYRSVALDPSNITVRQFLGLMSSEKLQDPFVTEASRNRARGIEGNYPDEAARVRSRKHYEQYIRKVDREAMPHQHGSLVTYVQFMDALIALADRGERPEPEIIRKGIRNLQQLADSLRIEAGFSSSMSRSSDGLEHADLSERAGVLFNKLRKGDNRPATMDDALYQEIMAYGPSKIPLEEWASKGDKRFATLQKLEQYIRESEGLAGRNFEEGSDINKGLASEEQTMADITMRIIGRVQALAKQLGVDTRIAGKRGAGEG